MADETATPEEDVSELRKAAEGGKAAKREAELAKRELAFVKAGVDTDSKPAQALLNSYEGDLTAEAIQAEATEWGLISAEAPVESTTPTYEAEQAHQAMRDTASGEPATLEERQLPAIERVLKEYEVDREEGHSQVQATNRAIGRMIQAAASGDPTAIFNEEAFMQKASEIGHGAEFSPG